MRLGLSSPLSHQSPTDWARQMKTLGCESVVFPLDYTRKENDIADYADAAAAEGLTIAEVGIWRNVLAVNPAEREAARAHALGQLRLAEQLGARCCVNISGTFGGPVWDGGYRENYSPECWQAVVEYTRSLIDAVRPVRTKYTLEPMPWMIPTDPDEYLKLLEDVDREAFGVHMDIINMINQPARYFFPEVFMDECFEKLGSRILSCHLKDIRLLDQLTFQLKELPCGEGVFPLQAYLDWADRCDPDMPVIIEHLESDQEYLTALNYIKKMIRKNETV